MNMCKYIINGKILLISTNILEYLSNSNAFLIYKKIDWTIRFLCEFPVFPHPPVQLVIFSNVFYHQFLLKEFLKRWINMNLLNKVQSLSNFSLFSQIFVVSDDCLYDFTCCNLVKDLSSSFLKKLISFNFLQFIIAEIGWQCLFKPFFNIITERVLFQSP